MDESTLTAILAVSIVGLFFMDSGLSWLGLAAAIPLISSKTPIPL